MVVAEEAGTVRRTRRLRSVAEKRRIVDRTMEPGASVAQVAQAHSVNANQEFKWRREFATGDWVELAGRSSKAMFHLAARIEVRTGHAGQGTDSA